MLILPTLVPVCACALQFLDFRALPIDWDFQISERVPRLLDTPSIFFPK